MTETLTGRTTTRVAAPGLPAGPLAWQRTSVIGTELVFAREHCAQGTTVVAGAMPYSVGWHAELTEDVTIEELSVSCRGDGWSRTLQMHHTGSEWVIQAETTPPAIDPEAVPRLTDSPVFVSWAIRRLGLTVASGPVSVPSVRILVPALELVPGTTTYHMVSPNRLRITGDGPAVTYDIDHTGLVTYQPGNLRLVR
ncbi:putative glycolipid-binding domain-containing protein [Actinoplanes sp. NPDC049802]|uniref:putative glycolipid-binding domain-containing protein n=1 Tax=Actinoplanes sp. NPDC049802 TaxID=3154742 RepID=UPI0033D3B943